MKKRIAFGFLMVSLLGFWMAAAAEPPIPTPTAYPIPVQTVELDALPETPQATDPARLPDDFGEYITESEHFLFYRKDDFFPVDLDWLIAEAENAYEYVSERLGTAPNVQIAVNFGQREEGDCVIRGMASVRGGAPFIGIFTTPDIREAELLGILAHEVAHAVHAAGFAQGMSPHRSLNEGLATWASADYWVAWNESDSLETMVRGFIEMDEYLPLHQNSLIDLAYEGDDCLRERDILYTEWAAFIDFLVEEYGWDSFIDLLYSSQPEYVTEGEQVIQINRPAAYEAIYGLSLNQLEAIWLATLRN